MIEPQESGIERNRVLALTLTGIGLLIAGTLLPAVRNYSGDSYASSLRYWDCWPGLAYLLVATAAIVLYWCGARRFNLLWYPALVMIALVAGPLVKTVFNGFNSHAWAKYIVKAEPGMRWPGQYSAWPGWLALVAGAVCLAASAWLARPPRWQRALAMTGVGLIAVGSYLPMQIARSHAVNFWFFPAGLFLVASFVLALVIIAVGKYRLLWIAVVGAIVGTVVPIVEASGQIRFYHDRLEQRRAQIPREQEIYQKQFVRNNPGMTAAEKLELKRKVDQETKAELARAEVSLAPVYAGYLYPLGIVVVSAGIAMLAGAAMMGRKPPSQPAFSDAPREPAA